MNYIWSLEAIRKGKDQVQVMLNKLVHSVTEAHLDNHIKG